MGISFKYIPGDLRSPGTYLEVDPSQANGATTVQRAIILAQKTSAGTATANVPEIVGGVVDGRTAFGVGSVGALMVERYRQRDPDGELWMAPLADPTAGAVGAEGGFAVTGTATENGLLSAYLGAVRIQSVVTAGMTAAAAGTALAAAIDATPNLPVTVTTADGGATLTFAARNVGIVGNDIDLRMNYRGARAGEKTPAGLAVAVTAMTGGAGVPDLTAALAALGDKPFDLIILQDADPTTLDAVKAKLQNQSGRWSYQEQIYGHAFAAVQLAFGDLVDLGDTRNDEHATILGTFDSPTPAWLIAADYAAAVAQSTRADVALPLQDMPLRMLAPPPASRFSFGERETLLHHGISTVKIADDDTVFTHRLVTSYLENPQGQPDNSYLDVETMFQAMFVFRFMISSLASKFARKKLVSNETRLSGATPNLVSPAVMLRQNVTDYRRLEALGIVQNGDAYARNATAENAGGGIVKILAPIDFANQLRITAILAQFTKS